MVMEDFTFYWSHRTLHTPRLYQLIHKKHHEYNITVSLASEYAHPLEYLLGNLLPSAVGGKLLGAKVHFITHFLWNALRVMETVDGHCGYEFTWSPFRLLPFSGSSSYHNFHHSKNVGNYSSFFTYWDTLFGTNKAYHDHLKRLDAKKLEAKKDK